MPNRQIRTQQLIRRLHTNKINNSANFLLGKRQYLADYEDIEDFAVETVDWCPENLRGLEHHFVTVRSALAKELWSRQFFLGVTVLDSLLFRAMKDASVNELVDHVLGLIVDLGLHRPGFVLYPVHSFGVLAYGAFNVFTGAQARLIFPEPGLAITPQLNSTTKVFDFLEEASRQLDMAPELPRDLLEHFIRSRPLRWLTNNPLLMMKTRVFSGNYYENQHLLVTKLKFATAFISMLASLGKFSEPDIRAKLFSSSRINNWQTLDIKHYLVFEAPIRRRRYFNVECIPMNVGRIELAEISDLDIEIDPREWRGRIRSAKRVWTVLKAVETGYFRYSLSKHQKSARTKLHRKFMRSLTYFKRSFRSALNSEDSVVNLAIAFEALLIDSYAPKIQDTLVRRIGLALRGVKGVRSFKHCIRELYRTRSEIVHGGTGTLDIDLKKCRKAYVHTFMTLVERLSARPGPISRDRPIGDLLGE